MTNAQDILALDYPEDGRVYLVEKYCEDAGLFMCNGNVMYAVASFGDKIETVSTESLRLIPAAELRAISAGAEFESGLFDVIEVIESVNTREMDAFLDLCCAHALNQNRQSLPSFFYSLISLFNIPPTESALNAIGLFGELSLIQHVYTKENLSITPYWQAVGPNSKYDFSFPEFNYEVKTTTSPDEIVKLKHSQLFNNDKNYLCLIHIERNPSGKTLLELSEALKNNGCCFSTLEERIALDRQLLRVSENELRIPFSVSRMSLYCVTEINQFSNGLPDRVTSVSYSLNLAGIDSIRDEEWLGFFANMKNSVVE